ncbi:Hypothetical protein D9617_2g054700 [Elsinoe fawcettii]|nr:Hypothetical protein D9617_2g054700 [Elsinoe fawcettii]
MAPTPSNPLVANFPSTSIVFASGLAIFHLASSRVVICRHPQEGHFFLPKGRKNASEPSTTAAIREGFEESGYRCRLVALPVGHRQPQELPLGPGGVSGVAQRTMGDVAGADGGKKGEGETELQRVERERRERRDDRLRFVIEPLWTQMVPVSARTQYVLFWYVGETLDWREEERCNALALTVEGRSVIGEETRSFVEPREWKEGVTVTERKTWDVDEEGRIREPVCHSGTGVDGDEILYEKYLVPIEEAVQKLKGTVMADVVKRGWELIAKRDVMEEEGYWEEV